MRGLIRAAALVVVACLSGCHGDGNDDWVAVSAGWWHSMALKADGTLYAWGADADGQLGQGGAGGRICRHRDAPATCVDRAQPVTSSVPFTSLRATATCSAARDEGGRLWSWGFMVPSGERTLAPRLAPAESRWRDMAMGTGHAVALHDDGSLWVFGAWHHGGDALVDAGPDWSAVASGAFHGVALKDDGTLWALPCCDFVPTRIGMASDWKQIAGAVALRADGSLWALEAMSDGGVPDAVTPIGTDRDWTLVTGWVEHTLALKADGTVWWVPHGDDPVRVVEGDDWVSVAAGMQHALGIRRDGSLWSWGSDAFGQLGVGDHGDALGPQRVMLP